MSMKKSIFYSLVGAGTAVIATPLLTFAHSVPNTPEVPKEPKTCEERVAMIQDHLQNAPEKQAEMRDKMIAKMEERLAKLPADKQEEARNRFEAQKTVREARADEMKAKAGEILSKLDGVCTQSEDAQKAVFQELRGMRENRVENRMEHREDMQHRRMDLKGKIKDFKAKRPGFRPMGHAPEEASS